MTHSASVNLGNGGPDGAVLSLPLPEILTSLVGELLSLAVVIGAGHRSSRWLDLRTGVIPVAAPVDAPAVGNEASANGCNSGCNSSSYIPVRMSCRHMDELQGVAQQTVWNFLRAIS